MATREIHLKLPSERLSEIPGKKKSKTSKTELMFYHGFLTFLFHISTSLFTFYSFVMNQIIAQLCLFNNIEGRKKLKHHLKQRAKKIKLN